MRLVFFTLLIGNVLLAAWLVSVSPARPPETPPVPEDLPRLQLLAERDYPAERERREQSARQASAGPVAACYEVGPFPTEADARRLAERLSGRTVKRELRRDQVEARIGHWVYLPAFPDRESAMTAARRLDDVGLSDYYVITAGDQENTISLGLYREQGNAAGRVQRLQSLGFDARSKVRTESVPRYYLNLALSGARTPNWSSLLSDYGEAAGRQTNCPEAVVATSGTGVSPLQP